MNQSQYDKLISCVEELKTLKARKERLETIVRALQRGAKIEVRVGGNTLEVKNTEELWADLRKVLDEGYATKRDAFNSYTIPTELTQGPKEHAAAALLSELSDDPEDSDEALPNEDDEPLDIVPAVSPPISNPCQRGPIRSPPVASSRFPPRLADLGDE